MTMTPQDIQSQQFHVRFRGFDVEEVDAFLERVAEELLVLIEENKQLAEQVEGLKKEIDSYHHHEKAFQSAIISAQQIAEEMKTKSRRAAEEITAAAREEARKLREEANREIAGLEAEIHRLKEVKRQAGQELRQLLQEYLDRLEEGEEMPAQAPKRAQPQPPESAPAEMPLESPPPAEPPAEPMAAAQPEAPIAEGQPVVDVSDLYEKIELTGNEFVAMAGSVGEEAGGGEEVPDRFAIADEGPDESTIPDLDGDMLFTLEDPLDEGSEGPAVSFDNEPEGREKDGKQDS
ncbi:MAG: DivIVA domain-containing protein [Desulfobacteraceae bacterium]|nr:DivIVA domain-containing protein [Desulfobacteraceae bacterium]